MGILLAPYFLLVFWYRDFFLGALKKTFEITLYTINLLSIPILLKTFFKPIKNEYRDGLVWFSRIMGIVVKSFLIPILLAFVLIVFVWLLVIDLIILVLPFLIIKLIFIP